MTPQSIENAPKDGSVILTECGFVRYLNQKRWAAPVEHGKWACCDPGGDIFYCADNGTFLCEPKLWTPIPNWLNNG